MSRGSFRTGFVHSPVDGHLGSNSHGTMAIGKSAAVNSGVNDFLFVFKIYFFIFGCSGSSLLFTGFL